LTSSSATSWDEAMSPSGDGRGRRGKADWTDIVYFLLLGMGAAYALNQYGYAMDGYEKAILLAAVPSLVWMGWLWRPLRTLCVGAGLLALFAVWLYSGGGGLHQGDIARADSVFLLKYLLSSQSAILWMCALFVLATVAYWVGYISPVAAWMGSGLTWVRSEEHTSELQSRENLVCRLLL